MVNGGTADSQVAVGDSWISLLAQNIDSICTLEIPGLMKVLSIRLGGCKSRFKKGEDQLFRLLLEHGPKCSVNVSIPFFSGLEEKRCCFGYIIAFAKKEKISPGTTSVN